MTHQRNIETTVLGITLRDDRTFERINRHTRIILCDYTVKREVFYVGTHIGGGQDSCLADEHENRYIYGQKTRRPTARPFA